MRRGQYKYASALGCRRLRYLPYEYLIGRVTAELLAMSGRVSGEVQACALSAFRQGCSEALPVSCTHLHLFRQM